MEPVPMPQVLDPDRIAMPEGDDITVEDLAGRVATLRDELRRSCEYGQQMWHVLEAVRGYLVDSLPDEPDADGGRTRSGATPTGAGDDAGWQAWMAVYGGVTSTLAGTRGDSGFGAQEAQVIAQHRRATRGA